MDLGANEWTTFWKVTFPLILPGILAAALLAFSLSIDDYVITSFTAGRTSTFPIFIWGAARIGVPVQVNVIGTAFFLIAVGFYPLVSFYILPTRIWQFGIGALSVLVVDRVRRIDPMTNEVLRVTRVPSVAWRT